MIFVFQLEIFDNEIKNSIFFPLQCWSEKLGLQSTTIDFTSVYSTTIQTLPKLLSVHFFYQKLQINTMNAMHIFTKKCILQYKQHMGVHDRWSCNFCNKTYTRRHDRDKHIEHAHSGSCIFMNAHDESGLKQKRGYCEMVLQRV